MNFTYKTLLSLDSIVKFLTQGERCIAIKLMLNNEAETTPKMDAALEIINRHQWEPPEYKIGQDRITRFYDSNAERWEQLHYYEHPILTEIQKLNE